MFPRKGTTKKYNHIALLIDRSQSTQGIAAGIRKQFNEQAAQINQKSKESDQQTHLSLYTFSNVADHPILFEVPLGFVSLNPINADAYEIEGMTALFDCVGRAVEDLSRFHETTKGDHSFLIIALTDGQENQSVKYRAERINQLMKEKVGTDVWTFAFLVPKGDKAALVNKFGVPEGNVQEWDQTTKGVETMGKQTAAGLNNFFAARAAGKKSVKSFFTDLSNVSARDVAAVLVEATGNFKKAIVQSSDITGTDQHKNRTAVIQEFCEKHFGQYVIGNAYYELMKREKVQDHKQFLLEDRNNGKLFGGPQARGMLGFPAIGEVSVAPGDHGQFRIYVKSTSVNRKLVEGSTVLYQSA